MPTPIPSMAEIPPRRPQARNVILITTAMLTFISFWQAAAVVLCDLASTAYYIGAIAEQAIGKAAPWYILAVMLFSYAVRALYMESSSMFTRGGVYRVVKEAEQAIFGHRLGGITAKLSVSALMFDYVLTGPISAVAAGQYFVGLLNTVLPRMHVHWSLPPNLSASVFALLVTAYFWWQNVKGIEESSDKAVKIMVLTTVMAVVLIGWSLLTLHVRGFKLPPLAPVFSDEALGWLKGWKSSIRPLGLLGLAIAFGHSLLAMSGEETLAQVYREIEAPKLSNFKKAGFVIFMYSMLLTSLVGFFSVMIIPDSVRLSQYSDNLISGLTMYLVGPLHWRLIFQAFVVLVGFLILAGAVNTSLVGANGVLNRLGEDHVLPNWLRRPHPRFGTSYRMINLTALLQALTIILCHGDLYMLGEAYAFGVIWSFVFKAFSVLVLRLTNKTEREWKVPGNIRLGTFELPMGLVAIFLTLFFTALVNLVTKKVATISGSIFTLLVFIALEASEKINERRRSREERKSDEHVDKVNLNEIQGLSAEAVGSEKPRRIVVAVRDSSNLVHLKRVLEEVDWRTTDVIVLTTKVAKGLALEGELGTPTPDEEELFTRVIAVAEKIGHSVIPLIVPSNNPFYAMARVARDLQAEELVVGKSGKFTPELQMENLAMSWGSLSPMEGQSLRIRILWPGSEFKEEIA